MAKQITIEAFRSQHVVIGVRAGADTRKIIQIGYVKKDGSLFVCFPYFAHSTGLVSVASIPAGQHTGPVSLETEGRCASHLVKYSHHVSGEALFSQYGKIFTQIRRRSIPLRSVSGHLFTVQAQGFGEFTAADQPRDLARPTTKRTNLSFEVGEQMPEAIRIVGRLYDARQIGSMLVGHGELPDRLGPTLSLRTREGDMTCGFAIANPHDSADQTLLIVTCHPMPRLNPERQGLMLFLGGFDPREQATDPQRATSFLAFTYPADNFDELRERLGTLDLTS
jgi:hypothetical protein